jgi:hypothetical protein
MNSRMKRKVIEIYSLVYHTIVTPYNLLDNIYIEGYSDIHYYKEDSKVICKLIYQISDVYYYYFDKDNILQRVVNIENGKQTVLFERSKELDKTIRNYKTLKIDEDSNCKKDLSNEAI